jgi:hypothetical protein
MNIRVLRDYQSFVQKSFDALSLASKLGCKEITEQDLQPVESKLARISLFSLKRSYAGLPHQYTLRRRNCFV